MRDISLTPKIIVSFLERSIDLTCSPHAIWNEPLPKHRLVEKAYLLFVQDTWNFAMNAIVNMLDLVRYLKHFLVIKIFGGNFDRAALNDLAVADWKVTAK